MDRNKFFKVLKELGDELDRKKDIRDINIIDYWTKDGRNVSREAFMRWYKQFNFGKINN